MGDAITKKWITAIEELKTGGLYRGHGSTDWMRDYRQAKREVGGPANEFETLVK